MRTAGFDQRVGRRHVDHFRRARIGDRAGAAHDQHAGFVDLERGIVDAARDNPRGRRRRSTRAMKQSSVPGVGEKAAPEIFADDRGLHQRGIEQIAGDHQKSGVLLQRLVVGPDDFGIAGCAHSRSFRRSVLPGDGERAGVELAGARSARRKWPERRRRDESLRRDTRPRAARSPAAGSSCPTRFPVLRRSSSHADVARDGGDVRRAVGGAADGGVDHDGVLEGFARQDARRA